MQDLVIILDTLLANLVLSFLSKESFDKDSKLVFKSLKLVYNIKSKIRFLKNSVINFLKIVLFINFVLITF